MIYDRTRVIQELMTMNSFFGKYYYTQFYLLCHMGTQIIPIHARNLVHLSWLESML